MVDNNTKFDLKFVLESSNNLTSSNSLAECPNKAQIEHNSLPSYLSTGLHVEYRHKINELIQSFA